MSGIFKCALRAAILFWLPHLAWAQEQLRAGVTTVLATPARSCSWAQARWGSQNRIAALKAHLKIPDVPSRRRFYYHASGGDRARECRNSSWTPRQTLNRFLDQRKDRQRRPESSKFWLREENCPAERS